MKTNYPKMHVSLYVKNIEETNRFYTTFFGQEPAKVEDKYSKFILEEPALIISFIENKEKTQPYFGHLGFQVDSIDELKKRLAKAKADNIVSLEEEGTSCCYALQDKFWVQDPNGISWEVYFFHNDTKFNDPHYSMEEKEACCSNDASDKKENEQIACC